MNVVPVTVVTGFLGAGKTTLVNHWLASVSRSDVAVIVNELGDVGIDGALLAARARTLVEIAGGCVCCSTQAELSRALSELCSGTTAPTRILVETSGAASPAGVLRVIARGGATGNYALDGVITVVDATRAGSLHEHDLALEQVSYADVVVLSRADACDDAALRIAQDRISALNGAAVVTSSARGTLTAPAYASLDAVLAARRGELAHAHVVLHAPASHAYESVSLTVEGALDEERFADFMEQDLARYAGRLIRTKGIVAIVGVDVRVILQGVQELVEITFGEPWSDAARVSRFVVIGFGLDREALSRAFHACARSVREGP